MKSYSDLIYENILPHYLAIGVTWERFMDSCPKELKAYDIAYEIKLKEQDSFAYSCWGNYGIPALIVAIDRCFNGSKSKSKYLKEPILKKYLENYGLTEEEIYEKELNKALLAEEMWIMNDKNRGLPETVV